MNDVIGYMEIVSKSMRSGSINSEFKYRSFEEFVLKNGREFRIDPKVKVKRGKMKQCFANAFRLADDNGLIYVEGFAAGIIPVLHAWCVDQNGVVYDPTWPDGKAYYGVPFDRLFLVRTMLQTKYFGVVDNWKMHFPLLKGEEGFLYKGEIKK